MTQGREQKIERICQAALERPTERGAFLVEACGGDEDLRRDVEQLLAHEGAAAGFLETPALAIAAHDVATMGPALTVGSRLGVYTIQSRLGSGGMGEVYRARDPALGRDVAIKVLPAIFTTDRERLARFEREARVLAALNHPNIATIHGIERLDGIRALVLELVDGETLADVIAAGPIPIDKALTIARQVADALEASHEKGILHRDLKPANIKIRPDGVVKVLDFGLAKSLGPADSGHDLHGLVDSPTGTVDGALLGTPAYMSPEQAQGKHVDRRTDIWAFGAVLFEMLSGEQAFNGGTTVEVLSAVLKTDPDWDALPTLTPTGVQSLIRRCLQKEPVRRLRDIADARYQVEEALSEPSGAPVLEPVLSRGPANGCCGSQR